MSVRVFEASALQKDARAALDGGERVIVSDGTKDLYAIVPAQDAYFLDALEDAEDIAAAEAANQEDAASGEPAVSLDEARRRLGL